MWDRSSLNCHAINCRRCVLWLIYSWFAKCSCLASCAAFRVRIRVSNLALKCSDVRGIWLTYGAPWGPPKYASVWVCVCVCVVAISMCVGICTRFAAAARTAIDSYHAPQNAVTCLPSPPQLPSPSPLPPPTLSTTTLMMPAASPSWACQWIMPCARRGRACVRVPRVRPCNCRVHSSRYSWHIQ